MKASIRLLLTAFAISCATYAAAGTLPDIAPQTASLAFSDR